MSRGGGLREPMANYFENLRRERAIRTRAMYERYQAGLTLEEVGAEFGIKRERVRQLFFEQHLPTRSTWESRRLKDRA
jgi:DNA-directed RNA polymerase sigma subunit (sigma70/sigma32)